MNRKERERKTVAKAKSGRGKTSITRRTGQSSAQVTSALREARILELRASIEQGSYSVDAAHVADALIRDTVLHAIVSRASSELFMEEAAPKKAATHAA